MTTVRIEYDFGSWDVGIFRFKGRQISQMPNGEIVCDMEQYKHELEQIDVLRPTNQAQHPILRRRWESGPGLWIIAVHSLSLQLAELRRKQASPTVQDLLKLNKVISAQRR